MGLISFRPEPRTNKLAPVLHAQGKALFEKAISLLELLATHGEGDLVTDAKTAIIGVSHVLQHFEPKDTEGKKREANRKQSSGGDTA